MLRIGDKTEEKKISETKKKNIDKGTRIGTPTKAKRQGRLPTSQTTHSENFDLP